MDQVQSFKAAAQKTIDHLKEELQTIRTGRAAPAMIEGLMVDAYGGTTKMKMMELATITNEGVSTLIISPYDQSTIQDIEKSILKSPLGLTPKVEGNRIRVLFPQLNEEQRQKFVKVVGQKVEDHRESIRGHRDEARKSIKTEHDAKTITDDDKFRLEKDIDAANAKFIEEIQQIKDRKEQQIMEV